MDALIQATSRFDSGASDDPTVLITPSPSSNTPAGTTTAIAEKPSYIGWFIRPMGSPRVPMTQIAFLFQRRIDGSPPIVMVTDPVDPGKDMTMSKYATCYVTDRIFANAWLIMTISPTANGPWVKIKDLRKFLAAQATPIPDDRNYRGECKNIDLRGLSCKRQRECCDSPCDGGNYKKALTVVMGALSRRKRAKMMCHIYSKIQPDAATMEVITRMALTTD